MESEDDTEIKLAENGAPILDQFSEEGFIDCAFRIVNLESRETEHRFHLISHYQGETLT